MKQKSNSKRLVVALSLALVLMLAIGGIVGLEVTPVANAEDSTLIVTHLAGMRSATPRIYWRLDAIDQKYTANQVLASGVVVKYTSGDAETTKNIDIKYTTASANKGPGVTADRPSGDYACLYFDVSGAAGDTLTIPSGTVLKGPDGVDKYILDQDYTFVYNSGWSFAETSAKVPVALTGASNGGRGATYFQAYCSDFLGDYYAANTALTTKAQADLITTSGTSSVTVTIKYLTSTDNKNTAKPTLQIQGLTGVTEGAKIVLKKGTTVFDNFTFDRDYTFTYIGTNCGVTGCWSMSASTYESDPEMTLSVRGGANNYLNLFTPQVHSYAGQQYFAMNPAIDVNGETKYIQRMHGLAMSGTNYSFGLEFGSSYTAQVNDIITLPKGTYILGYRLADTYRFKWDGSAWSIVTCDGTNHILNDEFTCHDRACACGEVVKATTEHTFADGSFACVDRNCTTCGDVVAGVGHTFASGTFACQDRECTVCSQTITATEEHVITGTGCTAACDNCGEGATVHTFPAMPDGGWTVDNATVTVTTQPDCTTEGAGTIKCEKCDATENVVVNALGHDVVDGEKYCSRDCGYRIAYTADDMDEVLALEDLTKYTYSDAHVENSNSVMGRLDAITADINEKGETTTTVSNDFLINAIKGESGYEFVEGKENAHNMLVSFSLNLSSYATQYRNHYVWLNSYKNGYFGIGFMLSLYGENPSLRVQYKSADGKETNIVAAKTLTGIALNAEQKFQFGAVQNSDGSFFIFAYFNGDLFFTGTLTNAVMKDLANEETNNGLGGAVAFRFTGSTSSVPVAGTICDLTHSIEGEQHACKDYNCKVCGADIAHTAEHSWGEGVKTGNGSCDTKEVFTRTCSVCQGTTTYEGNYVHVWDEANPIVVTPAQCNGVDKVVKYDCTLCDAESAEQAVQGSGIEGAHIHVYADVVPATCVAGGTEQGTCSKCGHKTEITDTPINEEAHAYGNEIAKVAETCDTAGTLAHYECSLCEKLFVMEDDLYVEKTASDLVIPASHKYVAVAEVASTCDTAGTMAHYACSGCDKLFVLENEIYVEKTASELVIPASHRYQAVAEVPATCTQNGTMAHYTCSGCDKLFVKEGETYLEKTAEQLVIVAGHNFVEGVCSACQAKDNVYFFNQAIANVTSATTAEAKFNALKVAIEKYNLLSSDEKASNKATIDAQIAAYNTLATQANQAHSKQTDTVATILGWVASVTAMAAAALVLKKIIR